MRTTAHSSNKESPFERHYGRKPRVKYSLQLGIHLNISSPNQKTTVVPAKPETLQVYSFSNKDEHHDQLAMKTPRRLKKDVGEKIPYLSLEKNVNKNKFETAYDTKPQVAITGTKHTITIDTNKVLHRKRASKFFSNTFQNQLSRRSENPRGPHRRSSPMRLDQSNQSDELKLSE